jgi:hypothetical protein
MPLAAGTRLGVYEIVSSIGEGGMGEVRDPRARAAEAGTDPRHRQLAGAAEEVTGARDA